MTAGIMFLLVLLNVAIAWWNCFAVGRIWNDTKAFGSTFDKVINWSAAIQAVVGFSIPVVLILTWMMTKFMVMGDTPATPEEVSAVWSGVMSLWYITIILPAVGSGFVVWGHSMKAAYDNRDMASIAGAGWNTFAQAHNTYSMFQNFGPMVDTFSSAVKNKDSAIFAIVIGIVLVSLLASVLLTVTLIQHYARTANSRTNQMLAQRT